MHKLRLWCSNKRLYTQIVFPLFYFTLQFSKSPKQKFIINFIVFHFTDHYKHNNSDATMLKIVTLLTQPHCLHLPLLLKQMKMIWFEMTYFQHKHKGLGIIRKSSWENGNKHARRNWIFVQVMSELTLKAISNVFLSVVGT